ncbi:terminase [Burkholderia vietnamiensis]|nr:terminase [Burkholderia vietnamiensis]
MTSPFRCGPVPVLRDWRSLPNAELTRAERAMRWIEGACVIPEGALVGQPIRLADFQQAFFYSVYDNPAGTRRALFSIARKNAKSATIACILLVHLAGPEVILNSQIVSGAMSRDQAALVFNLASKMVMLSKYLQKKIKILPSGKRLIGLEHNVEYRALSAEAKTAHGLSPVLAILDEIGQIRGPQDDFIDAITTSQGAHANPLLIALSTQAATDADLLSQWLDDAERSGDPRIVSHLYAAPNDAKLDDRSAWAAANPALGLFRSLADLEEQMKQAARMPSMENTARNLLLNQRVSVVSPFISRDVWESCRGTVLPFDAYTVIYGGLDLSARTDLTSLVLIGKIDGKWHSVPYFWAPEEGVTDRAKRDRVPYDLWASQGFLRLTPGKSVDYEYVAHDIADICSGLNVHSIAYDRWRIDLLKKEFADMGVDLPLVPHGQGYKDFSPALDALEAELINARMVHDGSPVLTMCAANAVLSKDPSGNRKLDKAKATGRIDGLVALTMAHGAVVLAAGNEDLGAPMVY